MGGAYQPQGHVHFLVHHLDFGYTLQEAIDTPRWRHQGGTLSFLEHGSPEAWAEGLRAKGHLVRGTGGSLFGGAQAIRVDPETGTFFGASDSRKDGAAIGF
jgi:gamma-glutamyltranspeptidase/glutathione hydrolase